MISIGNVTFDCAEPIAMAAFWSAALGRPVDDGASEYFASIGMAGEPTRWLFIKVSEAKTAKNRMHIDFASSDSAADVERLVGLGATKVGDHDEWGHRWTVMADVEGNEFCVSA